MWYEKISDYGAAAYQRYQAEKLKIRFNSKAYLILSRAMDSHNLGRGRGELAQVINRIGTKTLLIGISSDILFHISELQFLSKIYPMHCQVLSIPPMGTMVSLPKPSKSIK